MLSNSSPKIIQVSQSKIIGWRHVAYTGKKINACMTLAGNPECKRPLGKSRFRRKDTIKNDLKETGWVGLGWFHLIQDRDKKRTLLKTLTNHLLFFFFFSSSSSSSLSSSTTVRCGTWLQIKCSSISSDLRPIHASFSFPLPYRCY
jgi:hypothetical protein